MFDLKLTNVEKEYLKTIEIVELKAEKERREKELNSIIDRSHELKATEILKIIAPISQFDFFISHSGKDNEYAKSIATILRKKGFTVFVDSEYWLFFDNVAQRLNKNHLHEDKYYGGSVFDHNKTIEIQKHCDVMLLASLSKILSGSKSIIFINTPSSTINIEQQSHYEQSISTHSPWIYFEILFSNILFRKDKKLFERKFADSIEYKLDVNNMTVITLEKLLKLKKN